MKNDMSPTTDVAHDHLLTIPEAAEYLRVSRTTMYDLIQQHDLPVVLLTSRRQIRRSTLEQFIADRTVDGGRS